MKPLLVGVVVASLEETCSKVDPLTMSTALVVATTSDAYSRPVVAATRAGLRDDVSVIEVSRRAFPNCGCLLRILAKFARLSVATLNALVFGDFCHSWPLSLPALPFES